MGNACIAVISVHLEIMRVQGINGLCYGVAAVQWEGELIFTKKKYIFDTDRLICSFMHILLSLAI